MALKYMVEGEKERRCAILEQLCDFASRTWIVLMEKKNSMVDGRVQYGDYIRITGGTTPSKLGIHLPVTSIQ
jgi:hypothetical protein